MSSRAGDTQRTRRDSIAGPLAQLFAAEAAAERARLGDWRAGAACTPESAFFFDDESDTDDTDGPARAAQHRGLRHAIAIGICSTCPVFAACAQDAITNDGQGIRAGRLYEGAAA